MGHTIIRSFCVFGLAVFALGGCKPVIATCGDGFCDRPETCATCASDCGGSCSSGCGDGVCSVGENCSVCARDCGPCTGCNDGACNASAGETCTTCPNDCGACLSCGDGFCSGSETCGTCPHDCGSCATQVPYQACARDMDCAISRDRCIAVYSGGTSRSFCGVTNCRTDLDCDNDMYGAPGLCVSFDAGSDFNCFHRCNNSSDCYSGFTCAPTDGNPNTKVCLPGSTGNVAPYRICGTTADCAGGLICASFSVNSATTHLCSRLNCSTDNDCPIDMRGGRGACLSIGGSSACWERCNIRGDCANTTQFDCTNQVGGNVAPVNVCVVR